MAAKDVPKKWEDLLDPEWKDGKLGVISSTHHWGSAGSRSIERRKDHGLYQKIGRHEAHPRPRR
jgi:ABC-type Fe3+ transport system substrate-binding protein